MRRWLGHRDRCPSCGIEWHREHGFELGPIALNVVVTFFALGVGMGIAFVATAPDFPVLVLTLSMIGGAILVPLIAYPFTFLVWQAFDLTWNRPDEAELERAAAAVAAAAEPDRAVAAGNA